MSKILRYRKEKSIRRKTGVVKIKTGAVKISTLKNEYCKK
jgi:hypothetical protein